MSNKIEKEETKKEDNKQNKIEDNIEKKEEIDKDENNNQDKVIENQHNNFVQNDVNNYNQNSINSNFNSIDEKNRKDIKRLKILVIILFVVCIGCVLFVFGKSFVSTRLNKSSENSNENNNTNVELKYTDTVDNKNEGTYVIDVSDVVDNVMPSIVAITSKTLVSSGNYGPFYSGRGNQYATGAGSGIIVSKTDSDLLILTNKHVIEDAEQLSVKFIDDESVDATIKGSSTSKDIAIISVPLKSIKSDTLKKIKIATMEKVLI